MRYSITSLVRNAFYNHKKWPPAWRSPEPQSSYDVIIVGGGGHGLATAYYLAKNHGINNVAVLELNSKGLLNSKKIYDLNNMNNYKFSKNTTEKNYEKNSYIYGVLTSLREKINAPAKRKKVSN